MESSYKGVKFTDADLVNKHDFIQAGDFNPHNVRPWLIHDYGHCVCVVFASNLQDALDEAVNADKLDAWQIDPSDESDRADYMTTDIEKIVSEFDADYVGYIHTDGTRWYWAVEPTYLGNAGEPFDIEGLDVVELPNPKFSFCALFNAMQV